MSRIHWSTVSLFVAAVLVAMVSRLLPHPPNFTPMAALGLFAGTLGRRPWLVCAAVVAAMLASDLIIGFHGLMPVIYGCLLANVIIGRHFVSGGHVDGFKCGLAGGGRLIAGSLMGSVLFFVVTNFAHFVSFYPTTGAGLMACYTAAIPFFQYTLAGDLFYSAVLFGAFALISVRADSTCMVPALAASKR